MTTELRALRTSLWETERGTYSPDDFPGSRGWREHQAAQKALDAFDLAHPEIIAARRAEAKAKELAQKPARDADFQRRFDAGLI